MMIVVLQDVESYRNEEKFIQERDQIDNKIQSIDKEMVNEEFKRLKKDRDDPNKNIPPTDYDG